jgi:3-oxoacyl-[acyl-carrier-protein] synthase II
MDRKRVVITGLGVISPIGIGKNQYWQSLSEGKSGFKPITLFDTSDLKVKMGGEISEFNPVDILGKKGLIDLDRATTLLLSATKFALEDSHIDLLNINSPVTGVSIGTTFGSLNSLSQFDRQSLEEGPNFVNASRFPNTVVNSPASRVAIRYGVKGPNVTISTGFCASIDALDHATHCINADRADRIMVGAVEEMCFQTFFGFHRLGYLSGLNNDKEPLSCPFDKRRDGIIFSEGSAVFILEDLKKAEERNANIYAEVLGIGSNFDPFRLDKFNPKGTGIIEAMNLALTNASLKPDDISCIFANANSTQDADAVETKAIKETFGTQASKIPITAIKSMIGESFSSSGALSLAAALGSITKDFIPPTVNLKEKDPMCDLNYVSDKARTQKLDKIMVNSFGPNGANSVLIIGKYKG